MSLHFPLPKTRTFRFSLHTSRLSLRGEVTMLALKFAMSSHFPLPKIVSPSLFPLFQMPRDEWSKTQDKRSNPAQSYIIGSAEALPILCVRYFWWEREREIQTDRDGSDVTIVVLYYRKRGSASYIVREVLLVREREREIQTDRDGSDVTIVVLKLAMSLHFPLPKIRTWRWVTLSLAGTSHLSILPSHFPSHPS